jgi:DNA-binding transcriptional regulator LsrR (DeoR family)
MSPVKEENRRRIRHLYFVQRVPPVAIAEEMRLSLRTVRRALVIRGGADRTPPAGPYRKESP